MNCCRKAEFLSLQRNTLVFVTLTEKYMTPHSYYDIAIEGQPKEQIYYHRSIQDIFNLCLELDLSLMDFMKNVLKPTKKFLW